MTTKKALALMLAAAMLSLATPTSAAERSGTKSTGVTASDGISLARSRVHRHSRHTRQWRAWSEGAAGAAAAMGNPWSGGPFGFGPGSEAYAQGSWHLNQDGQAYQVPYDCAYPLGYDSGGAAIFDRGCHLP
jgi:hypothetical protein